MGTDALKDLVGKPHRPERVVTIHAGPRSITRGADEVIELQGQGFAAVGLNLVNAEDLAKQMLFHRRWLGHIDAGKVKLPLAKLL